MRSPLRAVMFTMAVLAVLPFLSCKDPFAPSDPLEDLETRLVSGSIGANLMPVIPPDPISCHIVIVAKNRNSLSSLIGLSIQQSEVFLDSADVKLGTISFSTTWDGVLGPNEEDTVRLFKVEEQTAPFHPPCGKYVYVNLRINAQFSSSRIMKIDSLLFGCVY